MYSIANIAYRYS